MRPGRRFRVHMYSGIYAVVDWTGLEWTVELVMHLRVELFLH